MTSQFFECFEDEVEYRQQEEQRAAKTRASKEKEQLNIQANLNSKVASAGEALSSAERLASDRSFFQLHELLPKRLADACQIMQQSLPVDTLSTVLPLLAGYSGLLRLNTRIAKSYDYSVVCNLYVALVCISGGSKSPTKQRLIDDPAKNVVKRYREAYVQELEQWKASNDEGKKAKQPEPIQYWAHLTDYSTPALTRQLVISEAKGLGQLIIRDELSGLLSAVDADTKSGSGTGEAQLLEAYDGSAYYSIRIEAGSRCYESCHLSIYGNIQPEALRKLINDDDSKGKFARFLFVQLPARVVNYEDDDPSDEEQDAWNHAQQVLRDYADELHALKPRHYSFSAEARKVFNRWWEMHQRRVHMPLTPPVTRSLLGKASANAIRLAGMLHLVRVVAGEVSKTDQIEITTVRNAMAIVDQLLKETEAFHEEEQTPMLKLMRHVHILSWNQGEPRNVDHQYARDKGGRDMRRGDACSASAFKEAIDGLELRGYGEVVPIGKRFAYRASRAMAS